MSKAGTPFEGRDNIILLAYISLELRLYTNTADSLTASTVLSDLTFPTGTGYATLSLTGVWSSSNGVITYDHGTPDNPQFENTGASNWTGVVTGAAITNSSFVLHFKDLSLGSVTMTPGKILEIDISTLAS